jgi:hypothetical protein
LADDDVDGVGGGAVVVVVGGSVVVVVVGGIVVVVVVGGIVVVVLELVAAVACSPLITERFGGCAPRWCWAVAGD